jgi:hypothetical protein
MLLPWARLAGCPRPLPASPSNREQEVVFDQMLAVLFVTGRLVGTGHPSLSEKN